MSSRASRAAAALGGAAAVLHVPLALAHAGASLPAAAALLLMSLVCLPCAGHLWRAPCRRAWTTCALAGTGMLAAHGVLLTLHAAPPSATPLLVTGHGAHASALPALGSGPALALVSLLTAAQVALCCAALARGGAARRRGTMPG